MPKNWIKKQDCIYKNEKDPTYNDKQRVRAGGSLECFGIFNKGNSKTNPSDKETKRIIDDIRNQSDKASTPGSNPNFRRSSELKKAVENFNKANTR